MLWRPSILLSQDETPTEETEMRAATIQRLTEEARKVYAHRVAADPDTCPVCCGDRVHTDSRFAVAFIEDNGYAKVYSCFCTESA